MIWWSVGQNVQRRKLPSCGGFSDNTTFFIIIFLRQSKETFMPLLLILACTGDSVPATSVISTVRDVSRPTADHEGRGRGRGYDSGVQQPPLQPSGQGRAQSRGIGGRRVRDRRGSGVPIQREDNGINGAGTDGTTDAHFAMIVHRTLGDMSRRRRNIVITGLPEEEDSGAEDRQTFLELCEAFLPVKPSLAEGRCCTRIGRATPDRPRKLLVRLCTEESASELLRAAPSLRYADDDYIQTNVFINADLSPSAAKLAYETRKRRRENKNRRARAASATAANVELMEQMTEEDADEVSGAGRPQTFATSSDDEHSVQIAASGQVAGSWRAAAATAVASAGDGPAFTEPSADATSVGAAAAGDAAATGSPLNSSGGQQATTKQSFLSTFN